MLDIIEKKPIQNWKGKECHWKRENKAHKLISVASFLFKRIGIYLGLIPYRLTRPGCFQYPKILRVVCICNGVFFEHSTTNFALDFCYWVSYVRVSIASTQRDVFHKVLLALYHASQNTLGVEMYILLQYITDFPFL